jgi:hypothetical protein
MSGLPRDASPVLAQRIEEVSQLGSPQEALAYLGVRLQDWWKIQCQRYGVDLTDPVINSVHRPPTMTDAGTDPICPPCALQVAPFRKT